MKKYNEFLPEEQKDLERINTAWFFAAMSDDYNTTLKEQKELLDGFNKKYGYEFHTFCMDTNGKVENVWLN